VVEKLKDGMQVVSVKTYLSELHGKKVPDDNLYTRFTAEIADVNQRTKMKKLYVGQTGLGSPIVEQCKGLQLPAEGLNVSSKVKEELLSNLHILFEQRKIILPSADRDLSPRVLSNLNCIEFERKASGRYVFSHPAGTHDDIAFELVLAVHPASGKAAATAALIKHDEPPKPYGRRRGSPPRKGMARRTRRSSKKRVVYRRTRRKNSATRVESSQNDQWVKRRGPGSNQISSIADFNEVLRSTLFRIFVANSQRRPTFDGSTKTRPRATW
jgi:hypothetical protein